MYLGIKWLKCLSVEGLRYMDVSWLSASLLIIFYSGDHVKLSDVCLYVTSGPSIRERSGLRLQVGEYLPANGCLLLSPANLWNRSMAR